MSWIVETPETGKGGPDWTTLPGDGGAGGKAPGTGSGSDRSMLLIALAELTDAIEELTERIGDAGKTVDTLSAELKRHDLKEVRR